MTLGLPSPSEEEPGALQWAAPLRAQVSFRVDGSTNMQCTHIRHQLCVRQGSPAPDALDLC